MQAFSRFWLFFLAFIIPLFDAFVRLFVRCCLFRRHYHRLEVRCGVENSIYKDKPAGALCRIIHGTLTGFFISRGRNHIVLHYIIHISEESQILFAGMLRDILAFDVSDGTEVGCFQTQNWFITYGVFHEIERRGVRVQITQSHRPCNPQGHRGFR